MRFPTQKLLVELAIAGTAFTQIATADDLSSAVEADYEQHLGTLFDYFHRNPELSSMETKTAARHDLWLRTRTPGPVP